MPGGTLAPSRLDELKKRFEENPRRFFAPLANEYRKSGDLDQAIALCQEHLADQAGNMNGHVVYGQALFDAGRYPEAEVTFATALALDPENLIALRHLGDIARTNNDVARALDWYQRVLDADPRNDEILGFIEELKGAAAAAPPPEPARTPTPTAATPISSNAVTPRVTRAVEGIDLAKTVEITATGPAKRMSLLDMSLDLGGVGESGIGAGLDAPLDLSPPTFQSAPITPTTPAAPAEPVAAIDLDSGLGWDMGSVDLVSTSGTADEPAQPVDTPQVFVTETMAELYLQQGFRDEALQVYRQLAEQNPDDASLRERIAHLERGDRASMSFDVVKDEVLDLAPGTDSLVMMNEPAAAPDMVEPAAAPDMVELAAAPDVAEPDASAFDALPMIDTFAETVASTAVDVEPVAFATPTPVVATPTVQSARAFFASLAQRRAVRGDGTPAHSAVAVVAPEPAIVLSTAAGTIDGLFGTASSEADDVMGRALATALATAVATVESAPMRGKPTQAAASELTLDSVFRSDSPARASGPAARQSKVLNFDQFFAPEPPVDAPAPAADTGAPPASPADDAQFNSWLQGLKDQ